jgi:hypothetical protein
MPHNMVFGMSNYVSITLVIIIVVVVIGIWWLISRSK